MGKFERDCVKKHVDNLEKEVADLREQRDAAEKKAREWQGKADNFRIERDKWIDIAQDERELRQKEKNKGFLERLLE